MLPKQPSIPDIVTAGLATVGLRVPSHPLALALIREAGVPIAAPSANPFTELSPTTAEHVRQSLGRAVDYGARWRTGPVGIESTVLSLAGPEPLLLRPGVIPLPEIEALIGPVRIAALPPPARTPRRVCMRNITVRGRRCCCYPATIPRPPDAAHGCAWAAKCLPIRWPMPPRCMPPCTGWTPKISIGSRSNVRLAHRSGPELWIASHVRQVRLHRNRDRGA